MLRLTPRVGRTKLAPLPSAMAPLPREVLGVIVDRLALAVFVFRQNKLVYSNSSGELLESRLRSRYRIELEVMLRDHLKAFFDPLGDRSRAVEESGPRVTLLTATNGEPFQIHVVRATRNGSHVAVTVRAVGAEIDGFRRRYRLSAREAQVAELVLHGYRNIEIAATLGITAGTTKKHLTHIYDKVGVNTRSQLQSRLT
jgi:DNA-binding CsgD family transcriptional regulator